jgi:zinc transport system substrate-binding protein
MAYRTRYFIVISLVALIFLSAGCQKSALSEGSNPRKIIVTSDTILSGMSASLLPPDGFEITAILPPGQCPGHYDLKLTDIAKVRKADLVISSRGMPFMSQASIADGKHLLLDPGGRNWMAPHSYITGLRLLADKFAELFPGQRQEIATRKEQAIREVTENEKKLSDRIRHARVFQSPIIASSRLKEPLEWMGFRVVGEYGRPESISVKEILTLTRTGREKRVVMVVDNLQSGPEAGKGIAEALGSPHVILSNFPSEKGYVATLGENVNAVLAAAGAR